MPEPADIAVDSGNARLGAAIGLCAGMAVPAAAFGKAVLGIFFGLAVLLSAANLRRPAVRTGVIRAVRSGPGLAWIVVFAYWTVGSALSTYPATSFVILARMAALAGLFLVVARTLAAREDTRLWAERGFAYAFAAVGILAVLAFRADTGLMRAFRPISDQEIDPGSLLKSFESVVAIALPVLIWIGWRRRGATAVAAAIGGTVGLALVAGLGSKSSRAAITGLVGAGLLVLLVFGLARIGGHARIAATVALLLLGGIAAGAVFHALPAPPVTEADRARDPVPLVDFHRQAIWGFVYHKALERPVTGFGIDTIDKVPGAQDEVLDLNQEYVPSHPHNWVLEVLSETGVPGLLLAIGAILATVLSLGRTAARGRRAGWTALAVLGAFWTSSLANFSIWAAWWQVAFLATLALPLSDIWSEKN